MPLECLPVPETPAFRKKKTGFRDFGENLRIFLISPYSPTVAWLTPDTLPRQLYVPINNELNQAWMAPFGLIICQIGPELVPESIGPGPKAQGG